MKFIIYASIKLFILVLLIFSSFEYELRFSKNYNSNGEKTFKSLFAKLANEGRTGSGKAASGSGASGSGASGSGAKGVLANIGAWLHISDLSFQDSTKYPPVVLPDKSKVAIDCDNLNYRLNPLYDRKNTDENLPKKPREFYFTLTPNFITYSAQKKDSNVIGAIKYTDIISFQVTTYADPVESCFRILQKPEKNEDWTVCSTKEEDYIKFLCEIQKRAEFPQSEKCFKVEFKTLGAVTPVTVEEKIIQPMIVVPEPSKKCNEKWNYDTEGEDWECFCAEGKEQSPIDLPKMEDAILSPVAPVWNFEEVTARAPYTTMEGMVKKNHYNKLKFMDNSLRIMHPNFGFVATLDGARYQAQEIIFHSPSEHTIDGKKFDLEMQVYCYGETKGDIAKQVILSILFEKKSGVYNQFIDDLDYFSLPNEDNPEKELTNNLFIPKVFYESGNESIPVMEPFSFYTYQGSMTEPPCAERTIVYVTAIPMPIASVPLNLIKEALNKPESFDRNGNKIAAQPRSNARKTQPLNGRKVYLFDKNQYCNASTKPETIPVKGHYEKIPTTATEYFYVNGNEASSLTGAMLVDKQEAEGITGGKF